LPFIPADPDESLIFPQVYCLMMYTFIFLISLLAIGRSGTVLVKAVTNLARLFQVSEYSLSFILAGIATSIPELFVGLSSAVGGISDFSFGNIIGANIINVSLIIGLAAFISGKLEIESALSRKNFWTVFGIVLLPILLSFDGRLSRIDGAILLGAFFFYIVIAFERGAYFTKKADNLKRDAALFKKIGRSLAAFLISAVVLLASSGLLVWSGSELASAMGIGVLVFGMIFVSVATALPELIFGIRASLLKHGSMAVGAVMGTVAFNAGFILGIVGLINPVAVQINPSFIISAIFIFLPFLLFNIFVATKNAISKKEGLSLFLIYIIFLILEYLALF